MLEKSWGFVGSGKRQPIKLTHDTESGEVKIYLNGNLFQEKKDVIGIDSSISFIIDDELCEIIIKHQEGGFSYKFVVHRNANTAKGKFRKNKEDELKKSVMYPLLAIIFLLIATPAAYYYYTLHQKEKELEQFGVTTFGKIDLTGVWTRAAENTSYSFMVDGKRYQGEVRLSVDDRGLSMGPLGMPIESGDEFQIIYSSNDPSINTINLMVVSATTLQKYIGVTDYKCRELHKGTMYHCQCIADETYKNFGIDGLADYFFQEESFIVNADHNSGTFNKMVEDPKFIEMLSKCPE